MKQCISCHKNISEFSNTCPYCGQDQSCVPSQAQTAQKNKIISADLCAFGAGIICILLGVLSIIQNAIPVMHDIPPTSIFAKLQAFTIYDVVCLALFVILGILLMCKKKGLPIIVGTGLVCLYYCYGAFKSFMPPLLHNALNIYDVVSFILPIAVSFALFISVLLNARTGRKSPSSWVFLYIAVGICIIMKIIWLVLSRRPITGIDIFWLPLLLVGCILLGKWLKEG